MLSILDRMKLMLHELVLMHPGLPGDMIDYARFGGLALQRSGHESPVRTEIDHDGAAGLADVEWSLQDLALLKVMDANRITEDGAEALALAYLNTSASWVVERRMRRGEHADWLLRKPGHGLALEVSGTIDGNERTRLNEKKQQIGRCRLPVERLAIVVAFGTALILAGKSDEPRTGKID
jgi:hypothetical protein